MDVRWESEADADAAIALAFHDPRISIIFDTLIENLCAIADRPLTPRELLAALPITNKERVRWTKDGRLPRSGSVTIRRGHLISVPTYSVSNVERIKSDPGILDAWRDLDG